MFRTCDVMSRADKLVSDAESLEKMALRSLYSEVITDIACFIFYDLPCGSLGSRILFGHTENIEQHCHVMARGVVLEDTIEYVDVFTGGYFHNLGFGHPDLYRAREALIAMGGDRIFAEELIDHPVRPFVAPFHVSLYVNPITGKFEP